VPIVGDSTSDQAQSVGRRSRKNKKRAAKKSV
jgi:hypothetical protein